MIRYIIHRAVIILALISNNACSEDVNSPSDQIIEGPFKVTTEWQSFEFSPPLQPAPYLQYIQLVSCNGDLEIYETGQDKKNYFFLSDRFRKTSDGKIVEPAVEAVINQTKHHFALARSTYFTTSALKGCIALGYRLANLSDEVGYFLPHNAKLTSILVKANTEFTIDKLFWRSPDY